MWRDGRKYRIWLHLMTQSPADLPPKIVDSCNNASVTQLKSPKDRDLMMVHLALSEKGFVDEHYKRFLSRIEVARSVVKLGYSTDLCDVQPVLSEPLMVPAREPTDAEIYRYFSMRAKCSGFHADHPAKSVSTCRTRPGEAPLSISVRTCFTCSSP